MERTFQNEYDGVGGDPHSVHSPDGRRRNERVNGDIRVSTLLLVLLCPPRRPLLFWMRGVKRQSGGRAVRAGKFSNDEMESPSGRPKGSGDDRKQVETREGETERTHACSGLCLWFDGGVKDQEYHCYATLYSCRESTRRIERPLRGEQCLSASLFLLGLPLSSVN